MQFKSNHQLLKSVARIFVVKALGRSKSHGNLTVQENMNAFVLKNQAPKVTSQLTEFFNSINIFYQMLTGLK